MSRMGQTLENLILWEYAQVLIYQLEELPNKKPSTLLNSGWASSTVNELLWSCKKELGGFKSDLEELHVVCVKPLICMIKYTYLKPR